MCQVPKLLCMSEVLECAFELSFMYLHGMCTNCTAVTGDPVRHLHRICSGNSIPCSPFSICRLPKVSGHVLLKLLMIVCMIRVYAGVHLGGGGEGGHRGAFPFAIVLHPFEIYHTFSLGLLEEIAKYSTLL